MADDGTAEVVNVVGDERPHQADYECFQDHDMALAVVKNHELLSDSEYNA